MALSGADGASQDVVARILVNAAGPWAAEVRALAGLSGRARLRLVKGSHIVVRRLYDGDHAYLLQNDDRRVVFAIPFERDFTLIGTTESAAAAPQAEPVTGAEIAYLCRAVGRWFERAPEPADIVWHYSGVRPLYDDGSRNASETSRDYFFELDETGPPCSVDFWRQAHHLPASRRSGADPAQVAPPGNGTALDRRRNARLTTARRSPGRRLSSPRASASNRLSSSCARNGRAPPTISCGGVVSSGLAAAPEQQEELAQFIASREPQASAPAGQTADR